MRARTEEELGMAVVVSARCVHSKKYFWAPPMWQQKLWCGRALLPTVTQAVRLHQPRELPSLRPQGGSARLDYNKPPSSPGNCPCSFTCSLFSLLTTFHLNKVVMFCFWAWTGPLYHQGKNTSQLPHWNPICLLGSACLQHVIVDYVVAVFPPVWPRPGVVVDSCKVTRGSGLFGRVCAENILQPWFKVEVLHEPLLCSFSIAFDIHRFCWMYFSTLFLKNSVRNLLSLCTNQVELSPITALCTEQWKSHASLRGWLCTT